VNLPLYRHSRQSLAQCPTAATLTRHLRQQRPQQLGASAAGRCETARLSIQPATPMAFSAVLTVFHARSVTAGVGTSTQPPGELYKRSRQSAQCSERRRTYLARSGVEVWRIQALAT
jgi:hypothetical protein